MDFKYKIISNALLNDDSFIFLFAFIFFFSIYYFFIYLCKFKFPNFYGECQSNEKTSMKHKKMYRGLGFFYIITLFPFIIYNDLFFNIFDLFLIAVSVIIGFWDDKKSLKQLFKLKILLFTGAVYTLVLQDFSSINSFISTDLILYPIYFIFMVLFFNQIDGINGLAGITFLVTLFLFSFFLDNMLFLTPIIAVIIAYLSLNLRGVLGIQGEAGSFFMGSVIFVLSLKINFPFHTTFSFIFLLPILIDISATTIVRFYLKKNIFEGHRSNLYQKLVAKHQRPAFVSLSFGILQIITGLLIIFLFKNTATVFVFIILLMFITLLTLTFLKIAFLINTKKFLNY